MLLSFTKKSLPPGFNHLLNRYELKDVVIKVVGVGSVGTACWVALLMTGDGDPLFLQAKEARKSVLEAYAGRSIYPNHGQRIVYDIVSCNLSAIHFWVGVLEKAEGISFSGSSVTLKFP